MYVCMCVYYMYVYVCIYVLSVKNQQHKQKNLGMRSTVITGRSTKHEVFRRVGR